MLSRLSVASVVVLASAFFCSSCSSHSNRDRFGEGLHEAGPPSMEGKETYFDGALLVEVNLGRGFGRAGQRSPYARIHEDDKDSESAPVEEPHWDRPESPLPPVALRLRLTNKGKQTIEAEFLECNSELGNFAVRPEKLALAPDQSSEPEAMSSRLWSGSVDLPLTLTLRVHGKEEKKIILLHAIQPPAHR